MPLAQLAALLRDITCYELMPTHGKLVTLDADLPMKHALSAMAQHNITCLPVWDSMQQRLVDVFTCSDLVDVVLFTHRALSVAQGAAGTSQAPAAGAAQEQIDACQLRDLHGLKRSKAAGFEMASVDDSLYNACVLLHRHGLECLPLGETAASTSLLHVLLPEQLLAYIASSPDLQDSAPEIFGATIEQAVLPRCAEPAAVRAAFPEPSAKRRNRRVGVGTWPSRRGRCRLRQERTRRVSRNVVSDVPWKVRNPCPSFYSSRV